MCRAQLPFGSVSSGQTVVVAQGIAVASRARDWRVLAVAAVVSIVTMPLTALWFLLIGGVVFVAGLLPRALGSAGSIGTAAITGLGLLAGPAVYISLAALQ